MVARRLYDALYRVGAPWEGEARSELARLVTDGRLTPGDLPRAIDLGCGSGANAIFLSRHGFDTTGVDFSPVALRKAQAAATAAGVSVRWMRGDLTRPGSAPKETFDLVVDYGTLDDLKDAGRVAMAEVVHRLTHPGSRFLLWCFSADLATLPFLSFTGPSRLSGAIAPGEEAALFGDSFEIERLPEPPASEPFACFLMTRR